LGEVFSDGENTYDVNRADKPVKNPCNNKEIENEP
jgi:hypothetical protein